MVGACHKLPNQDEEVDELFYKQLREVSQLLGLVPLRDFNLLNVCWRYKAVQESPEVYERDLPDTASERAN